MNKALIGAVGFIASLGLVSCKTKLPEKPKDNSAFWETFYKKDSVKTPYSIDQNANLNKASFGYELNTTQGLNGWYYYEKDGLAYKELQYDNNSSMWGNSDTSLKEDIMKSTADKYVARGYKVSKQGDITISGKIASLENKKVAFQIYKGNDLIFPQEDALILENDTVGNFFEIKNSVNVNDMIYFVVNGEATCNPTIYYSDLNEVLYQVPDWNFYGDVHPFFHDGKMYMYNLQAYLEYGDDDARYMWCMHTSKDMFNYVEEDYEVYPFVTDHYNSTLNVYESIFDKETFPFGSRDMFLFFDHVAKKYVYFGLCYYRDRSVCLGCRVSDDETGVTWSTPMFSIRDFKRENDPECSQAMYINDRWYIITSIWGQSIHSVGRPAYLIGDKGKAFLENDWSTKEMHYLDGEDLCAAQLVHVGDGHYQMYGWIPKTSYSNTEKVYFNGTRDHGLWGGNINQCREVYQGEDGLLFTRLDPKMTKLLSRGKLYSAPSVESGTTLPSSFNRTFVTFDVDMKDANSFTYKMTSNEKEYEISLVKTSEGVLMQIYCAQDKGHKIASSQIIGDALKDKYSVKLIIDHSIVEFFIDDKYSLTARTSMFEGEHNVTLESDGNALFNNVVISKLAHQADVYD